MVFDEAYDEACNDAVTEWVDGLGDVPDGFADLVVDAEVTRRAAGQASRATTIGLVCGLLAAALVLLFVMAPQASDALERRAACGQARPFEFVPSPTVVSVVVDPAPAVTPLRCHHERSDDAALGELRAAARSILAERCAPCHVGDDPRGNPAALKVFDVEAEQWWTTIGLQQLDAVNGRMAEHPADEQARVSAFVDAERKARG